MVMRHEHGNVVERPRRGDRGERVAIDHLLLTRVLHVHDRALAGDDDGLLQGAHAQVGVDGGGERAGEGDAFARTVLEPCRVKVTV
jgi:hypothetical protein